MSDSFLAGLLVGLIAGGFIGTLALALVASGSDRAYRNASDEAWRSYSASPSAHVPAQSSLSVNLLPDVLRLKRSPELVVAEADDIEREMRELVRRFGTPSGS